MGAPPAAKLRFLYCGSSDLDRDFALYRDTLGAKVLWDVRAFGARVAALDVGPGPQLLLADHRPPGTVMPVYEVADLKSAAKQAVKAGATAEGKTFGIPNGPCRLFKDGSGQEFALFEDVRPGAMESGNS